jgi:hypothetical protein
MLHPHRAVALLSGLLLTFAALAGFAPAALALPEPPDHSTPGPVVVPPPDPVAVSQGVPAWTVAVIGWGPWSSLLPPR